MAIRRRLALIVLPIIMATGLMTTHSSTANASAGDPYAACYHAVQIGYLTEHLGSHDVCTIEAQYWIAHAAWSHRCGWNHPAPAQDGYFGWQMYSYVISFQQQCRGWAGPADGIIGGQTLWATGAASHF